MQEATYTIHLFICIVVKVNSYSIMYLTLELIHSRVKMYVGWAILRSDSTRHKVLGWA